MALSPASSHLVLARKWRPERFDELVGQEHVTRTLVQALRSGRIAHAFLFTGIRGVGKTTAARIFARCLNCEKGPTPEPCGTCAACLEIRAGGALDTVEIDGATYRKIDDARAIIENLGYRPARDRFKIYIIDEAHQLTDQAFNALLKTLEEPPAHVKFILATTEPEKMPETILSRLQRYDFRRIPFTTILARLKQLAAREESSADEAALSLLAREAGGSMRDAERMLETAIASLDGKVDETSVAEILGVASRSRVIEITAAVIDKDAPTALAAIRELHQRGANLESMGRDILEVIRNLTVAKLPGAESALTPLAELPDQEAAALRSLAEKASLRDLQRLFHLLAEAQEQLLRSPYPDLILEMALVRMAMLAPVVDADELLQAIGSAGAGGAARVIPPATSSGSGSAPGGAPRRLVMEPNSEPAGARRIPFRGEVKADAPGPKPQTAPTLAKPSTTETIAPAQSPTIETTPPAISSASDSTTDLPDLRDFIRSRRAALAGFMEQGAALRMTSDTIIVEPRKDIYQRYLSDNRTAIAELATELYGRKIKVELGGLAASADPLTVPISPVTTSSPVMTNSPVANGPEGSSSAVGPMAESPRSNADVKQALYADPVARRIFSEFEARLVEVRAAPPADANREEGPSSEPKKK
jgi:DNA polymerase-3 subunit gamma/tau